MAYASLFHCPAPAFLDAPLKRLQQAQADQVSRCEQDTPELVHHPGGARPVCSIIASVPSQHGIVYNRIFQSVLGPTGARTGRGWAHTWHTRTHPITALPRWWLG
eukprot:scaffold1747_cov392-Prasinococcus_capsulatus_cf.AAC.6